MLGGKIGSAREGRGSKSKRVVGSNSFNLLEAVVKLSQRKHQARRSK